MGGYKLMFLRALIQTQPGLEVVTGMGVYSP